MFVDKKLCMIMTGGGDFNKKKFTEDQENTKPIENVMKR